MSTTDQLQDRMASSGSTPPGVQPIAFAWGDPSLIGSAAFWVARCQEVPAVKLELGGGELVDEVIACLLGGYGVPADIGVAAFQRLREAGAIRPDAQLRTIERLLGEPFDVPGRPRPVKYRFPRQRARRVIDAVSCLAGASPPDAPLELRDWLVDRVSGVGPKTASWVVRNLHPDASVAVIDIHVHRAGIGAGFFDPQWRLPTDYRHFEAAFVWVAARGEVDASRLDHTIWSTMAMASPAARAILCRYATASSPGLLAASPPPAPVPV